MAPHHLLRFRPSNAEYASLSRVDDNRMNRRLRPRSPLPSTEINTPSSPATAGRSGPMTADTKLPKRRRCHRRARQNDNIGPTVSNHSFTTQPIAPKIPNPLNLSLAISRENSGTMSFDRDENRPSTNRAEMPATYVPHSSTSVANGQHHIIRQKVMYATVGNTRGPALNEMQSTADLNFVATFPDGSQSTICVPMLYTFIPTYEAHPFAANGTSNHRIGVLHLYGPYGQPGPWQMDIKVAPDQWPSALPHPIPARPQHPFPADVIAQQQRDAGYPPPQKSHGERWQSQNYVTYPTAQGNSLFVVPQHHPPIPNPLYLGDDLPGRRARDESISPMSLVDHDEHKRFTREMHQSSDGDFSEVEHKQETNISRPGSSYAARAKGEDDDDDDDGDDGDGDDEEEYEDAGHEDDADGEIDEEYLRRVIQQDTAMTD